MNRIRVTMLIFCFVPIVSGTRAEDPRVAPRWYDEITVRGFIDVYYRYDFNDPYTRRAQLRAFDGQHDSIHLNLSELSLEKKPAAGQPVGFLIDVDYGPAAEIINASEPAGPGHRNVGQAYLSYRAPIGSGLQFDLGKFRTSVGNEVVPTSGNWNYSRSLLFTFAEPTYHAGIRASYVVNPRIAFSADLFNGWNNVRDNNSAKSVGLQATVSPAPDLSISETYIGGAEQTGDNHNRRHLADTVITYKAGPKVTLAVNYDYGRDSVAHTTVRWQGLAGYVRFQPTARFALASRWEWYDDADGFTTGTPQRLEESTVTGEWKPVKDALIRIEYRRDSSCHAFFLKNAATLISHQDTFTVGFIYAFGAFRKP